MAPDSRLVDIKVGSSDGSVDVSQLIGAVDWVVQNRDNAITKLQLDKQANNANVLSRTKDARFDVPTTIAEYNGNFYLPNARFGTSASEDTSYNVVSVLIP